MFLMNIDVNTIVLVHSVVGRRNMNRNVANHWTGRHAMDIHFAIEFCEKETSFASTLCIVGLWSPLQIGTRMMIIIIISIIIDDDGAVSSWSSSFVVLGHVGSYMAIAAIDA